MSKVAISEEILQWAVDRSGRSIVDLETKFPKISQWIIGKSRPTLKQLSELSKATFTPLGFFFLTEPPEEHLSIPHFRTLGDIKPSKPSPDLLETIQLMQRRQTWMREYLIDEGQERLSFVKSSRLNESPQSVAQRIRKTLSFDDGWASRHATWREAIKALRLAMEMKGILVTVNGIVGNNTYRKLNREEFRGFVLVDDYAPLVFVNNDDYKAPQIFTLAHELAHIFFGSSAAFDLRGMQPADNPTEQACNRVAAEFLVPEERIRRLWATVHRGTKPFQNLAREFKVSKLVIARRALDLELIKKSVFLDFYRDYRGEGNRIVAKPPSGGDFYNNQNFRVGRRFATTVVRAAKEGKLLYSEAYRLTGLYGKTFEHYSALLESGEK